VTFDTKTHTIGFSPAVAPLGELSFRLHRDLAAENGGRKKWGYVPSIGTSYTQPTSLKTRTKGRGTDWIMDNSSRANAAGAFEFAEGDGPSWLTRYQGDELEVLSSGETTAQVDPRRLCDFLLAVCRERGVQVHQPAKVLSVSRDARDEVAGVRVLDLKDGVETDSKSCMCSLCNPMLTTSYSTMHKNSHNSRSLDSQSLFIPLPLHQHPNPHHTSRRLLRCPQIPALDDPSFRKPRFTRSIHNRQLRLQPRILLPHRRGDMVRRSQQLYYPTAARCGRSTYRPEGH
jgi:hypothetical protein